MQIDKSWAGRIAAHPIALSIVFLAAFALSRLLVAMAGIAPDPALIANHWQHADLALLASDPAGTLWTLHAQPPLWNAVLAAAVALAGPESHAATAAMHALHLALSMGAGLLTLSTLQRLGFGRWTALAIAIAASVTPSAIYYEKLIFYPLFTVFLVTLLVWLLARVRREGPLAPAFGALAVTVALAWTWAVFHPVFIAAFGAGLILWLGRRPALIAAALAALALSALPTLKNAALFGVPSASSWLGMNLAQTAPGLTPAQREACDFFPAHWNAARQPPPPGMTHPSLTQGHKASGDPNFNHAGLIARSQACASLAKDDILAHPLDWARGRLEALIGSHQKRPWAYDIAPSGWREAMGWLGGMLESSGALGRIAGLALYAGLWLWALRRQGPDRPLILMLALIAGWFTFATHIANGGEQERMRFTIEPVYMIWMALAARDLWAAFTARRNLAATTQPA